jgi:starch synthase
MVNRPRMVRLLASASVFVCPSIYEPFGIVNVEAMGAGTAVVASAVGGIVEVVMDGETGRLVPYEKDDSGTGTPRDREKFARDFAARVNEVATDTELSRRMGEAGRARAVEKFSWPSIAAETVELYRSLGGR